MVKFELSDSGLMLLGGVTSLAYGAHALLVPDNFDDLHFGPKETHPLRTFNSPAMVRWNGQSMATIGALTLAARDHLTGNGTRRWFQTSGASYGVAAALAATNAYRGKQRKNTGYTSAAVLGTLAALNMWRGFKKHNSTIKV